MDKAGRVAVGVPSASLKAARVIGMTLNHAESIGAAKQVSGRVIGVVCFPSQRVRLLGRAVGGESAVKHVTILPLRSVSQWICPREHVCPVVVCHDGPVAPSIGDGRHVPRRVIFVLGHVTHGVGRLGQAQLAVKRLNSHPVIR